MNFFVYLMLFMIINSMMWYSPLFAILLYGALIYLFVVATRKRKAVYQNRYNGQQYNAYQQRHTQFQNTNANAQTDNRKAKEQDVFDVEYTQEDV